MKLFIFCLAVLLAAAGTSCTTPASISGRPDPNTSTTGTIGSVKATDGVLPIGENNTPRPKDTTVRHR